MKQLLKYLLAIPLVMASVSVWAVGLGELKILSNLNQGFYAELDLIETGQFSTDEIVVSIASYDTFARYQLERPIFFDDVEILPLSAAARDGVMRYAVQSNTFVHEPFLHFIVEARWPGGRVLREYTALLELPPRLP